jgi:hypothetical protein
VTHVRTHDVQAQQVRLDERGRPDLAVPLPAGVPAVDLQPEAGPVQPVGPDHALAAFVEEVALGVEGEPAVGGEPQQADPGEYRPSSFVVLRHPEASEVAPAQG